MTRQAWWLVIVVGCATTPPAEPEPSLVHAAAPAPVVQPPRTWRPLANTATFAAAVPQLLTDGTVLIQELDSETWLRLTPDVMGSYANGTWSTIAPAPSGYSPLYNASAILPDGRLIVEGGEYIAGIPTGSTRGALYDPIANAWQEIQPPNNWTDIGDASGVVLPNGHFLLSACCTKEMAILDLDTLTWIPTGDGKADINDEEGWALLPDNTILTVDANNYTDLTLSEIFTPATGQWTPNGDTPVKLADTNADTSGSHEVGPEILRPDGTVVAIGGTIHNAVYDTSSKTWSALPDTPMGLAGADAPAAMLPNGDVLLATSPPVTSGIFHPPTHFFEIHGSTFTEVAATPNAPGNPSYSNFMLVLPTGEILMTDFSTDIELYTPAPGVSDNAVPVILDAPELVTSARAIDPPAPLHPEALALARADDAPVTSLYLDRTYTVAVRRMNGISQGAYYGDDVQSYTNFPIVRLTNADTGHVSYLRTYGHSNRSIAPDSVGTTRFDVPETAERGLSSLVVIANGIASPPITVSVK